MMVQAKRYFSNYRIISTTFWFYQSPSVSMLCLRKLAAILQDGSQKLVFVIFLFFGGSKLPIDIKFGGVIHEYFLNEEKPGLESTRPFLLVIWNVMYILTP